MKKALPVLILLLAAIGVRWFLSRSPSDPPRPPERRAGEIPPADHLAPPPAPSDLNGRALAVIKSKDVDSVHALAAEWRRTAREDAEFRGRLGAIVLDASAAPELRAFAALVMGSLPDREAMELLARALEASTDPTWTRTLLLALGSDRSSGTDDDIFGLGDSPRVIETSIGLAIRIRGALGEASVRSPLIPRLREAGDAGVRWAAAQALADSAGFEDVRRAFLEALPGEADPAAQGQLTKALTDWAAGETSDSPGRAQVVAAIFDGALRPDASALRLRSEDGLKRMAWTEPDVRALAPRIESGPFDQRRWAIAVLAGASSKPGAPARGEVFESLSRVAAAEPDAKVRELAVTAVSSFPDQPSASKLLMGTLADPAWHVRAAAARALGRMGKSEEILAALQKAEEGDADERVRRAAAETRRLLTSK